jgi:formylglycine-generating enzyme required for sulfatase activity
MKSADFLCAIRGRLRRTLTTALLSLLGLLTHSSFPPGAHSQHPDPLAVKGATASLESEMKPYAELIEHTGISIELVPIPSGTFLMGSPETETDRNEDEGPQREIKISPFWMAKFETTWDAYEVWTDDLDVLKRKYSDIEPTTRDHLADEFQLSQPTNPYTDMTFSMGKRGFPAICMTQHAARTFCKWLTAKTGRYYRLPTEAEWEYACRAGSPTAYAFGDDPADLDEYAWHYDNSDDKYQKVGRKKPNSWGLYDMHGNVAEWVLDQYVSKAYVLQPGRVKDPLAIPETLYPRVVRGGGWDSDPEELRCAARAASEEEWKAQDPQIPRSIWYHTDALDVGFRIVRPLRIPSNEEQAAKWGKTDPLQIDLD